MTFTCCCSTACPIDADTFSTTNDPPTGWTEVSGSDWATNGSYLSTTTSNAVLKWNTQHPDAVSAAVVRVGAYGANGDEIRVIVDYVDSSNYRFAQLTIGDPNGCLALYERIAGSNTLLSSKRVGAAASTIHSLRVYFGNGQFVATLGATEVIMYRTGTGTYVGLGTGTIASTVRFSSFSFNKHLDPDVSGSEACEEYEEPCLYAGDTISRADSSDVGCTWSEQAGAWSIVTNELYTASANAYLRCEAIQFDGGGVLVNANGRGGAVDDEVRVIVNDDGAGNYHYAELIIGTSKTLKIKSSAGATLATATVTTSAGTGYGIIVCLEANMIQVTAAGSTIRASLTTPTSPRYWGLGCGANTGGVTFGATTQAYRTTGACPGCGTSCSDCLDGVPGEFKIYFPPGLFTAGGGALSGTYYLPRTNPFSAVFCNWTVTFTNPVAGCGADTITISATVAAGGGYIEISMYSAPFVPAGCDVNKLWRYTPASSPLDCDGLVDEPLDAALTDLGDFPLDGALTPTISSA